MQNVEKIKPSALNEWLDVKAHSRGMFVKLRSQDVDLYDVRHGDLLLVKIQAIKKVEPRENEAEALEQ